MVRVLVLTLFAAALTGCGGKSYKVDHPVVGPAPPRIPGAKQLALADDETQARGQSDVRLVSTGSDTTKPYEMSDVVATVNGRPILVGAVLAPIRGGIQSVQKQATAAQYRQLQEQKIRELLPAHLEQVMMVSVMETKLTAEQSKGVNAQIDKLFEMQLEKMRASLEAKLKRPCSLADLEAEIQSQGLTLGVMRKMFGDNAIAEQYVMGKLEQAEPLSRPEILAAYRERIEEFSEPAAVKWQQIQVSFKNFDNDGQARQHAEAALNELKQGVSFTDVAKKYSDGPDAANGGIWDWTQYESLLTEIQGPLTRLPVKTPSEIIATPASLQIVQVVERRETRVAKSFEEVQEQLRQELMDARHKARIKEILDELRSQCVVTTIFDAAEEAGPATPAADEPAARPFQAKSPEGG